MYTVIYIVGSVVLSMLAASVGNMPLAKLFQGSAFGPLSVLASMHPTARERGEAGFLLIGGLFGSAALVYINFVYIP